MCKTRQPGQTVKIRMSGGASEADRFPRLLCQPADPSDFYPSQNAQRADHRQFVKKTGSKRHFIDAARRLSPLGGIFKDVVDHKIAAGEKIGNPGAVISEGCLKAVATVDKD